MGTEQAFKVLGLFTTQVLKQRYFVLKIKAPNLTAIRVQSGLPKQLQLYDYWVDLHITVAKQQLN